MACSTPMGLALTRPDLAIPLASESCCAAEVVRVFKHAGLSVLAFIAAAFDADAVRCLSNPTPHVRRLASLTVYRLFVAIALAGLPGAAEGNFCRRSETHWAAFAEARAVFGHCCASHHNGPGTRRAFPLTLRGSADHTSRAHACWLNVLVGQVYFTAASAHAQELIHASGHHTAEGPLPKLDVPRLKQLCAANHCCQQCVEVRQPVSSPRSSKSLD